MKTIGVQELSEGRETDMKKTTQVLVNKALSGGCSADKKTGWIDFNVDEENVLRLTFPVEL